MKKIVIAIHGLGNKPPQKVLETWWLQSIQEGLARIGKSHNHIPFQMVYWANITHETLLDPSRTDPKDPFYLADPYVKGASKILAIKPSFKATLFKYIEEQLDKVFLNDDLSINFKGVTDHIIHHYFSDLERYYGDHCLSKENPRCSAKADIQNRLLDVLKKYNGYEVLLIAHSMGSIVAFDVFNQFSDQLHVDTLVTIGSPLGLPVIVGRMYAEQKALAPHLKKPKTPDCIWPNWFNLADPEDKVAMDPTLKGDYGKNRYGIEALDLSIYNDYEINGERNAHKSYGYLRTPELAGIIDLFLSRPGVSKNMRHLHQFTRMATIRTYEFIKKYTKKGR